MKYVDPRALDQQRNKGHINVFSSAACSQKNTIHYGYDIKEKRGTKSPLKDLESGFK